MTAHPTPSAGKVIEKPMLFSGDMVRAILDGRKTVTRRVITKWPCECGPDSIPFEVCETTPEGWQTFGRSNRWSCKSCLSEPIKCPHPVGSRIWVRETLYCPTEEQAYAADIEMGWRYSADDTPVPITDQYEEWDRKKMQSTCVSIHMPRWASRITLEVTDVRVERLQDISGGDAVSEGIVIPRCGCDTCATSGRMCTADQSAAIMEFAMLWQNINGPGSWDANPWVWVYTFKHLSQEDPHGI